MPLTVEDLARHPDMWQGMAGLSGSIKQLEKRQQKLLKRLERRQKKGKGTAKVEKRLERVGTKLTKKYQKKQVTPKQVVAPAPSYDEGIMYAGGSPDFDETGAGPGGASEVAPVATIPAGGGSSGWEGSQSYPDTGTTPAPAQIVPVSMGTGGGLNQLMSSYGLYIVFGLAVLAAWWTFRKR